jgi:hypothetical protein
LASTLRQLVSNRLFEEENRVPTILSWRAAIIAVTFAGSLLAQYRYITVDYPGQPSTSLIAINAAGQIVGLGYDKNLTFQISFFTDTHGGIGGSFQYPGAPYTHSFGIDNAGNVVGQFIDFSHGGSGFFIRSVSGAFTALPLPTGLTSVSGLAISGNGAIAVSFNQSLYFRAADGSYTSVVVPGAGSSLNAATVTGIDNAGNAVGFYYPDFGSSTSFFRDTHGVFHPIFVPGSVYTEVEGMNNLGQAVGFYYDGTSIHGFLWRGGSDFSVIDYPGARNVFASGINDSGVIAGFYDGADIVRHGLIALPLSAVSPVPAPPSLWLVVTGCLALLGCWFRWRRRPA